MPAVLLSARAAIHQAAAALHAEAALHPNSDTVFLTFADIPAMDVLAFLGAWGLMQLHPIGPMPAGNHQAVAFADGVGIGDADRQFVPDQHPN